MDLPRLADMYRPFGRWCAGILDPVRAEDCALSSMFNVLPKGLCAFSSYHEHEHVRSISSCTSYSSQEASSIAFAFAIASYSSTTIRFRTVRSVDQRPIPEARTILALPLLTMIVQYGKRLRPRRPGQGWAW